MSQLARPGCQSLAHCRLAGRRRRGRRRERRRAQPRSRSPGGRGERLAHARRSFRSYRLSPAPARAAALREVGCLVPYLSPISHPMAPASRCAALRLGWPMAAPIRQVVGNGFPKLDVALSPDDDPSMRWAEALDRVVNHALSRVTLGLSLAAVAGAYFDWLVHLAAAPGKQLQLLKRLRIWHHAATCALTERGGTGAPRGPRLHRHDHAGRHDWAKRRERGKRAEARYQGPSERKCPAAASRRR
jgi:hypothetical protein